MKEFDIEYVRTPVVYRVICNKCGEDAHKYEHFSVFYQGGYESILGDGTKYKFDLCEKCLGEFMDTLLIPAKEPDEEVE